MKILVADLTVKDAPSSVILMWDGFGTPSVKKYYELIGLLSLLYVDVPNDYGNVGGTSGIRHVNDYDVDGYFFLTVIFYFLLENSSKALSYCFPILFSLLIFLGFHSFFSIFFFINYTTFFLIFF